MPEQILELEVGETLHIDDYLLTVMEVDDEDVIFRITQTDGELESLVTIARSAVPR